MRFKEMSVKRTFNTGDYQSVTIGLTAELTEDESVEYAGQQLEVQIHQEFLRTKGVSAVLKAKVIQGSTEYFTPEQQKWADEFLEKLKQPKPVTTQTTKKEKEPRC